MECLMYSECNQDMIIAKTIETLAANNSQYKIYGLRLDISIL